MTVRRFKKENLTLEMHKSKDVYYVYFYKKGDVVGEVVPDFRGNIEQANKEYNKIMESMK